MKNTEVINHEFNRLLTEFEEQLKNEKPGTEGEPVSYLKELFSFMEHNGITALKQINQKVIDSYIRYLQRIRLSERTGNPLSTGSVNKHKLAIRKFWKFCSQEKISANSISVQLQKYEKKPSTVLSQKEIELLFSVTDNSVFGYRDRCMLALYYGCGLRRMEGLKLEVSDIDFGRGRIFIKTSKNNRQRYVMMSPLVQKIVEEYVYEARDFYLSQNSKYDELFIGERGKPIHKESLRKRMEALWERVRQQYNIEKTNVGLHSLRHSLGTHLYMAGMDVNMIALMLGHRTLEATQLYIHSANKLKKKHEKI